MKVLSWVLSIMFIMLGVIGLDESAPVFASTIVLLLGIVLLPPVYNRLPLPVWTRWFVIAAGVVVGIATVPKKAPVTAQQQAITDSTAVAHKIADDVKYAYLKANRAIKKSVKDPDSYQEVEHRCGYVNKEGVYVSCLITYRAKNSFGGYVVEKAMVSLNAQLEPIDVTPVE